MAQPPRRTISKALSGLDQRVFGKNRNRTSRYSNFASSQLDQDLDALQRTVAELQLRLDKLEAP